MIKKLSSFVVTLAFNLALYSCILIALHTGNSFSENAGLTIVWVVAICYLALGGIFFATEGSEDKLKPPGDLRVSTAADIIVGIQVGGMGHIVAGVVLIIGSIIFRLGIALHGPN